jgi:TetR/AcrR family transcriptional repressor of nem operon
MKRSARHKLLEAAMHLIRSKGWSATTVDELCAAAGVTKGAFFHHFAGKEALGVAAAEHWSRTTSELFAQAPYHEPDDPLDRVLAYVAFRRGLIGGPIEAWTCVAGTLAQEVHATHPAIRDACGACIRDHAATLEADLAAAIERHGIAGPFDAASLAEHTQTVLQGAFVVAKASGDEGAALRAVDHLRRYLELLFGRQSGTTSEGTR